MKGQGFLRQHQSKLDAFYRISDSLLIAVTMIGSAAMMGVGLDGRYVIAIFSAITVFYVVGDTQGLYRSYRGAKLTQQMTPVLTSWAMTVLLVLGLGAAMNVLNTYAGNVMLMWAAGVPVTMFLWRLAIKRTMAALRAAGYNTRRVAIIGAEDLGFQLSRIIETNPAYGLKLVGFYDDRTGSDERTSQAIPDHELKGSIDDAIALANDRQVDLVYIALSLKGRDRALRIINELSNSTVAVHLVPDLFVFDLLHSQLINIGPIPTLSVYESPFFGTNGWLKRTEDVVLASVILLICAIPMLLIAIGVKLTSPGPVIFKQRRYGVDGKEIRVWKFRSMTTCDDGDNVVQARKGDARVTPFGAFLRKTSLDELPQFLNVLQGDMSIVGPRPHAVAHNEHYRRLITGYMLRHKVKPGITGWAQVNGWRGETDTPQKMHRRIEHDIQYIRSWSLWFDLRIIFKTVFVGFTDKAAY